MVSNLKNWPAHPGKGSLLQMVGFFCAVLLLSPIALAGTPTPYGEYFVRLGERWSDAGNAVAWPKPAVVSAVQDGASYLYQLSLIEGEGGPYADTLAEPLAGLARLLRQNGDIKQAQQLYRRALHVVRVNEGLYSERQVPILKELFETYRMTGDLAMLDSRYNYYFRLYGSGQPPYTTVRLGAALEYLRWQREALRLGLDRHDAERLHMLYSLNEHILAGVVADPFVDFVSYRALVLSQLRNLYLLQDRYKSRVKAIGELPATRLANTWDDPKDTQYRLETLQRNALAHGRKLLGEFIIRIPPERLEALAAAWLELADWNQWNDRRSEALTAYEQVAKLLRDAGQVQLLLQWLGQPVELPANGAFWQPRELSEGVEPIVIRARYDVSAVGRADNIEATAMASEYEGKADRLRRKLAQTRFRPRIVNGEPEAEIHLLRDYEVLD